MSSTPRPWQRRRQAQGPWTDLALHTLGWKAFQDLCAQVCEEILKLPVEIYREAQDGGQDAVFLSREAVPLGRQRGRQLAAPIVATIQCKFTAQHNLGLKLSHLNQEEEHIRSLEKKEQAKTYILMTNMSVDAPVAVKVKRRLRELGVIRPHVFGRQYLTRVIRNNARLRALVPRIYGLGDLSVILDERQAAQTKALLGHMLSTLKVYVPTEPHLQAVKCLGKNNIVLLLGDPATGKSTIAAILATTAAEHDDHPCYKADGPDRILDSWNPDDPSTAFYWIDDAFGANQPRDDYIDKWIAIMPKIQTAIAKGNRFVLTSRRHIYEAAKPKLGARNHPLFKNGEAIVNVGDLTIQEREQILYNHIKAGNQSPEWKSRVKPQLKSLANEVGFLPEIARRLGDVSYTQHISTANDSLIKFIREPKEHLIQTIEELSDQHKAALTLVFLHRGQMPVGATAVQMQRLVLQHFSVSQDNLGRGLGELNGSFLVKIEHSGALVWAFKHPTIADAISAILGRTEGLGELYLRGTKSEIIIVEAVCIGAKTIQDAVVVHESLNDVLVERLAELPNEGWLNRRLFEFLQERASDDVFKKFVTRHGNALYRNAVRSHSVEYDPRVRTLARAHSFGLLMPDLRDEIGRYIESSLLDDADTTFLDDDDILALINPSNLLRLASRMRDELICKIESIADEIVEGADLDLEPEDNFDDLRSCLSALDEFFDNDEKAKNLLAEADSAIVKAVESVEERKRDKEIREEAERSWDWRDFAPSRIASVTDGTLTSVPKSARSIFSDVDQ